MKANLEIPYKYGEFDINTKQGSSLSLFNTCGFLFCQKGHLNFTFNDKPLKLNKNQILIYLPLVDLKYENASKDAQCYQIESSTEFVVNAINKVMSIDNVLFLRQKPYLTLNENQIKRLNRYQKALEENQEELEKNIKNNNYAAFSVEIIKNTTQALIYWLMQCFFSHQPTIIEQLDRQDFIYQNFMLHLYQDYKKHRNVAYFAKKQELSARYFSQVIHKVSGHTPLEWISKVVIEAAKQMLDSNITIKDVSMQLSFKTQSFFGKYFKLYTGISPKEYKER